MTTGPAGDGLRARVGRWLRTGAERMPLRWVTIAVTTLFLAATAAFGGLEPTVRPALPELAAGEQHRNDLVALTPQRAVLIDALPEAGASPGPGQRVLAVVVDAEATWHSAVRTIDPVFRASLLLADAPDEPAHAVARFDDTTRDPVLQPGVPAQLVVTWLVPADRYAAGDELRLLLQDHTAARGAGIVYGDYWSDPVAAAHATVPVQDVGAGADAEAAP